MKRIVQDEGDGAQVVYGRPLALSITGEAEEISGWTWMRGWIVRLLVRVAIGDGLSGGRAFVRPGIP